MLKILISYSYSHMSSSSGNRCRILNRKYLLNDGWEIYTSSISPVNEKNCVPIKTLFDTEIKPISYKNTKARRGVKKIIKLLLWPDRGVFWSIKAYFVMKKKILRDERPVSIVSVCYPFSSLLLAAFLKKTISKKIYLTSHFIDGFFLVNKGNDVSRLWKWCSYYAEKFVLKHSDKILICEDKKQHFKQIFPKYVSKAIFVPTMIGIDLETLGVSQSEDTPEKNASAKHLIAGSLYRDIRNPYKVIRIYEKLSKSELLIAGNLNDTVDLIDNASWVTYLGLLSQVELMKYFKRSDVLVNIDNQDSSQQSPGKIIEYMNLQKKIINFYTNRSISAEILDRESINEWSHININLDGDLEENILKVQKYCEESRSSVNCKLFNTRDTIKEIFQSYSISL